MKKVIKAVVLMMLLGMSLSLQALTFWDIVAVWLVAKTIERVAGVTNCSNPCCSCECKKNFQCRMLYLKKLQKKKLKEKNLVEADNEIFFCC